VLNKTLTAGVYGTIIVSRFPSETTMCLQMFIMIIDITYSHHIYMEQKEGERGQDTRETGRDSVCKRESNLKMR
jgi:hypothetical protein